MMVITVSVRDWKNPYFFSFLLNSEAEKLLFKHNVGETIKKTHCRPSLSLKIVDSQSPHDYKL